MFDALVDKLDQFAFRVVKVPEAFGGGCRGGGGFIGG